MQLSKKQKELFIKSNVTEIFPEYYLIKVNNFNETAKDTLDEWIYYFKTNKIEENFTAKGLKEAKEILREDNLPEKEIPDYKRYLEDLRYQSSMAWSMRIEAEDKIREEVREEERKKMEEKQFLEKLQIAKNLKDAGVAIDIIMKSTGLTKQHIENLK